MPPDLQFCCDISSFAALVGRWEGSGNVAALDVLRAMVKDPLTSEAFFDEVELPAARTPAWTRLSKR